VLIEKRSQRLNRRGTGTCKNALDPTMLFNGKY
jgi:hypothetical protein